MPLLLAAAAEEPISLADAKAWLRIDHESEDALIGALIVAARAHVESVTRRLLVAQTWRVEATAHGGGIRLPFAPLRAIAAIRATGVDGVTETLTPDRWAVADADDDPIVSLRPARTPIRFEIDAEYGYGAAADAPAPLRQAIRLLVAFWHERRGDEAGVPPGAAAALIGPFVCRRIA